MLGRIRERLVAQRTALINQIKVYPDRLCIYDQDTLIAHHLCSYDRRQDIEDPEHPRGCSSSARTPASSACCASS
jgi:hypothetical protein